MPYSSAARQMMMEEHKKKMNSSHKKMPKSDMMVEEAMKEVHKNIPSTVERANVSGAKKEAMLRAIAFSKARKAGAHIPKK